MMDATYVTRTYLQQRHRQIASTRDPSKPKLIRDNEPVKPKRKQVRTDKNAQQDTQVQTTRTEAPVKAGNRSSRKQAPQTTRNEEMMNRSREADVHEKCHYVETVHMNHLVMSPNHCSQLTSPPLAPSTCPLAQLCDLEVAATSQPTETDLYVNNHHVMYMPLGNLTLMPRHCIQQTGTPQTVPASPLTQQYNDRKTAATSQPTEADKHVIYPCSINMLLGCLTNMPRIYSQQTRPEQVASSALLIYRFNTAVAATSQSYTTKQYQ